MAFFHRVLGAIEPRHHFLIPQEDGRPTKCPGQPLVGAYSGCGVVLPHTHSYMGVINSRLAFGHMAKTRRQHDLKSLCCFSPKEQILLTAPWFSATAPRLNAYIVSPTVALPQTFKMAARTCDTSRSGEPLSLGLSLPSRTLSVPLPPYRYLFSLSV